jgi:hypothetical protein
MRAADIPHSAHEFWSTQDTVIAPLKMSWLAQRNCDFRMISLDIWIVVLRALSGWAAA